MTSAVVYGRQSHGKKTSIEDQLDLGIEAAKAEGWELNGAYSDKVSASRYGTQVRGGWAELVAADFDVLVLWESSRASRDLPEWSAFLADCRRTGRRIHVITHERTYDPRRSRDWKTLADEGVKSAYESEEIAERTRRGLEGAAKRGKPASLAPFGYRRVFEPDTGLAVLVVDEEAAAVVRDVFERVAKSEPLHRIAEAYGWTRMRVRRMALKETYAGLRRHNGRTYPGSWEPIVDAGVFAAAQRVLNEPARLAGARPGRQVHLLSYFAVCICGKQVVPRPNSTYGCPDGHVSIGRAPVDELIEDLAIARLSSPDLYAALARSAEAADETVKAAHEAVTVLTAQLEDWRKSAWDGRGTSPESLAAIEAGLTAQIDAAQAKIDAATVPADLEGWVGPEIDVSIRWAIAPVQARRTVLRALGLRVEIAPSGGRKLPAHERVAISWVSDR